MNIDNAHNFDTRAALLETAEELFLSQGFETVSIRQLTKASGTNVAAVNYHFKGKTNLYREVLAQRLDMITHDKMTLLEQLDRKHPGATLEDIITVYIRSFFEAHLSFPNSDRLMQIIYREMGPDAVASDLVAQRLVSPINQAFKKSILKACPELDEQHVSFCVSSITGQVLHFIRGRDILRGLRSEKQSHTFFEDVIKHIVQFSLRGLGSSHYA